MVQFRAIKMSTKDLGMDLGGKRKLNCAVEDKIISLTVGNNGNFISARILLQINKNRILIANDCIIFHEFYINIFLLVIFYMLIFFLGIVSRTGNLSSADRRRFANHDFKNHCFSTHFVHYMIFSTGIKKKSYF